MTNETYALIDFDRRKVFVTTEASPRRAAARIAGDGGLGGRRTYFVYKAPADWMPDKNVEASIKEIKLNMPLLGVCKA